MRTLSNDYKENVATLDGILRVNENFDILKKVLTVGNGELTLYYIDGFIKDSVMEKLMIYFLSLKTTDKAANDFLNSHVPYVETEAACDLDVMIQMVLSGAALMLGTGFGEYGIIIDAREYPARTTAEPENDRVMRGPRDGFVETLIFNTALIRRRIRDPGLTMHHITVGKMSKTDVVVCYIEGKADPKTVNGIIEKISAVETTSLTLGQESLKECLVKNKWYNPFPKVRVTERPDTAAAQLYEGGILVLCDNSPQVMVLPTSIFDFLQETNDFYFPPLTGTYLRIIRHWVFLLTLFLTPLWYLLIQNPGIIPPWLAFIIPQDPGKLPILVQLLLVEFIIDGLRMASMNTPDMLTNSLSIVGALILGDFAVTIGWLIPEVILYMAFVAIANFTQGSYELGYAFKFCRIGLLILTALFNYWGFFIGLIGIIALIALNNTVSGERRYLYPLIPFNGKVLLSLFFRVKKKKDE